jgi:hypothetical protein
MIATERVDLLSVTHGFNRAVVQIRSELVYCIQLNLCRPRLVDDRKVDCEAVCVSGGEM